MQPLFINHNLRSSVSHHLSKIRKFWKSLPLTSGIRVLSQQSVSLWSIFIIIIIIIIIIIYLFIFFKFEAH